MISARSLAKAFGRTSVLDDFSLEVASGELLVILGPSGCGKTTALRLLAGLEDPDSGEVHIGKTNVTNKPAHLRDVGFVFQKPAYLSHRTVVENIAYPLMCRDKTWFRLLSGRPSVQHVAIAEEIAGRLGLSQLLRRRPSTLSGGELQRMALARALAKGASVLLLDEPLSSVDERLRDGLRLEIMRLKQEAQTRDGAFIYLSLIHI